MDQLTKAGLGQTTAIGIGGDPIIGTTTKEAVELLMMDPETEGIVMIGEIGGGMEAEAAHWIRPTATKSRSLDSLPARLPPKAAGWVTPVRLLVVPTIRPRPTCR